MLDIGRVCIKTAGRETGKIAIVVKKEEDGFVLVDGNVKRRKCNVGHLQPTDKIIKIKENDSTGNVHKAMEAEKMKVVVRKPKKVKKEVKQPEKKEVKTKKVKK